MRPVQFTVSKSHLLRGVHLFACALLLMTPLLASARSSAPLKPDDISWLRRDGFGLDTASVMRYRELGRGGLLDAQLADHINDPLPPAIASLINGYQAIAMPPQQLLMELDAAQQHIKTIPDGPDQVAAKKNLQDLVNQLQQQAEQAEMLQAVYGPNQLKEQLVWFWLNHFSVYAPKGRVRWELGDYTRAGKIP